REGFTRELTDALRSRDVDLVAMAGFGTIVTNYFHLAYPGRVLNTHPSLLPAFKGWHAVTQALASGVSETGCTVHIATEQLDDGPILAQRRVSIESDDTEESLHERIKLVERELYPLVVGRVMAAMREGREPSSVAEPMEE
ncbi:MAG TPA: formyltransferase family protein, partial [Acidimicrobiales bacterium]|nr:formyltransferase family protein [Acidimicrobiales bacterium]